MTTQTIPLAPAAPPARRSRPRITSPAVAGLGYVAACLAGLAIGPAGPGVNAAGTEVIAAYAGHRR